MTKQNALFDSGGVDALFGTSGNPNEYEIMIPLDDIEVEAQVREEFEDDTYKLADLGRSLINDGQVNAIIVRLNRPGREKPYLLVAGERRCRAARLVGLTELRAQVKDYDDKKAAVVQVAENIHSKNLTQVEEARKMEQALKEMTKDEVLELFSISSNRLSKMLGLLHLPEQAKRLLTEDLSADIEVINAVRIIEKHDPEKAKDLVDDLKQAGGKANTREAVKAVKDSVKPPKKKVDKKPAAQVDVFAGAKKPEQEEDEQTSANQPTRESVGLVLSLAYSTIFLQSGKPKSVLDDMSRDDREMIEVWLRAFYEMGVQSKDAGRDALKCLRDDHFAADGVGAFALAAFMYGVARDTKFSLLDIFGSVKA
jgi:ParB family chromosome partitioning protein